MAGSKGSKYYDIFLDYSINLQHRELGTVLDTLGFKLLRAIDAKGSLKLATDEVGVSYRKAWGSIEEMEQKLGFKLVERQRGGNQGGRTELSEDGKRLIAADSDLRDEFDKSIKEITRKFFHNLNQ